jgi:hypothetical protein
MLKWSPEAVVGAVALGLSTFGGLTTTAIHWGVTNAKIEHIEAAESATSAKLDAHQAELSAAAAHNAAVEQKLDDMISRLDRIERKL